MIQLEDLLTAEQLALIPQLKRDRRERLLKLLKEHRRRDEQRKFFRLFPDRDYVRPSGETIYRRELYPKHLEFFAAGARYRERCFLAGNRVGKAQPANEKVITPSGFRKIGQMKPGDLIIGSTGTPTRVIAVYPQGMREIVTITMSDGSQTRCDLEHLWSVRPVKKGRRSAFQVMRTRDLRERIQRGERWMLPERPVVEFELSHELPIDPYLLGLLLGDGGLSTGIVLLSTTDAEIAAYCKKIASEYGCEFVFRGGCTYQFASHHRRGGRFQNRLVDMCRGLGINGTSSTKRVPHEYLTADAPSRLALLQGLMDTDGSCGKNGSRQFYSVNHALCEDVATLARSLGMNASVRQKNGQYDGKPHSSWFTQISRSKQSIFRLSRKQVREIWTDRRMRGVMIETIEPAGAADCVCIEVEASDSLYLTNDFIVTHNTVAGAFEMTCHLTGLYPHWWTGRRFKHPIRAWAAGETNETTRDIVQAELLGEVVHDSGTKRVSGTGMIPGHLLGSLTWKGSGDLADIVQVRHASGRWSSLGIKSYQQKRGAFQGTAQHVIWLDEECPIGIYGECLMRTATTRGIVLLTFTPLLGITRTVLQFLPKEMRPMTESD